MQEFSTRAGIGVPWSTVTSASVASGGVFENYIANDYNPVTRPRSDRAATRTGTTRFCSRAARHEPAAAEGRTWSSSSPTATRPPTTTRTRATRPAREPSLSARPSSIESTGFNRAVTHADQIKGTTKIFAVGVGAALNNRLPEPHQGHLGQRRVSGDSFATADFTLVTQFSALKDALAKIAKKLCESSVAVTKKVDSDGDGQFDDEPTGWRFDATLTGAQSWKLPSTGPASTGKSVTVESNGVATFQWTLAEGASATFTFSEERAAGVPPHRREMHRLRNGHAAADRGVDFRPEDGQRGDVHGAQRDEADPGLPRPGRRGDTRASSPR